MTSSKSHVVKDKTFVALLNILDVSNISSAKRDGEKDANKNQVEFAAKEIYNRISSGEGYPNFTTNMKLSDVYFKVLIDNLSRKREKIFLDNIDAFYAERSRGDTDINFSDTAIPRLFDSIGSELSEKNNLFGMFKRVYSECVYTKKQLDSDRNSFPVQWFKCFIRDIVKEIATSSQEKTKSNDSTGETQASKSEKRENAICAAKTTASLVRDRRHYINSLLEPLDEHKLWNSFEIPIAENTVENLRRFERWLEQDGLGEIEPPENTLQIIRSRGISVEFDNNDSSPKKTKWAQKKLQKWDVINAPEKQTVWAYFMQTAVKKECNEGKKVEAITLCLLDNAEFNDAEDLGCSFALGVDKNNIPSGTITNVKSVDVLRELMWSLYVWKPQVPDGSSYLSESLNDTIGGGETYSSGSTYSNPLKQTVSSTSKEDKLIAEQYNEMKNYDANDVSAKNDKGFYFAPSGMVKPVSVLSDSGDSRRHGSFNPSHAVYGSADQENTGTLLDEVNSRVKIINWAEN
jgi:hypothetical protein